MQLLLNTVSLAVEKNIKDVHISHIWLKLADLENVNKKLLKEDWVRKIPGLGVKENPNLRFRIFPAPENYFSGTGFLDV